jgi:hypothetical protein
MPRIAINQIDVTQHDVPDEPFAPTRDESEIRNVVR